MMFFSFEDYRDLLERELSGCPEQRKTDLDGANNRHAAMSHSFLQRLASREHTFDNGQIAILAGIIMSYADYGEPYEQNRHCLVA